MKVLIDITHPAYAHFFRHVIPSLRDRGHDVLVTSREKDVAVELLEAFGIEHECISTSGKTRFQLLREMVVRDWRLCRIAKRFQPDVILARDGLYGCQVGWFTRTPAISFDDTDDATLQHRLYFPFAWRIYTDKAYRVSIGRKQRFYKGVSCLAYLHPSVFTPDDAILRQVGLAPGERFTLCRLVSWTASHDYGHHGFDLNHLKNLVDEISKFGRVLVSGEVALPDWLEKHRISLPSHQMHHLMAKAALYVGESATMAAESAVLGVPGVFVSSRYTWYTELLEHHYGLVKKVDNMEDCLAAALVVLKDPSSAKTYGGLRDLYLADTDDLIGLVHDALEEVPLRGNGAAKAE